MRKPFSPKPSTRRPFRLKPVSLLPVPRRPPPSRSSRRKSVHQLARGKLQPWRRVSALIREGNHMFLLFSCCSCACTLVPIQMLEDMQGLLHVADEKRQASITEISLKHQKQIENMEAQIADILADRSRASETIFYLRALIMEKDAKIAEMEAASSGEVARLKAAMKALKGEFSHSKNEHEAEREILSISAEKDKALQDLKDALTNFQTEIATRDAALRTAEQHIKSIQMNLDSAFSLHLSEKEA